MITAACSDRDVREPKLPAWAQDIINRQRRDIARYKKLADELAGGTETNIIVEPYRQAQDKVEPTYLPSDADVRFVLARTPEGDVLEYIDCHLKLETWGEFKGRRVLAFMASGTLGTKHHSSNTADMLVVE